MRWGTAIGAGVLALAGCQWIWEEIQVFQFAENFYVRALLPVALLVALLYAVFWVVGRQTSVVDFMVATEGEMKKVSWSTRREVWGATKVVIVTVLAMGTLLAVVDALFMTFFGQIGVLKNVKVLEVFFGAGEG